MLTELLLMSLYRLHDCKGCIMRCRRARAWLYFMTSKQVNQGAKILPSEIILISDPPRLAAKADGVGTLQSRLAADLK